MEIVAASAVNLVSLGVLWYLNLRLKKERLNFMEIGGAKVYSPAKVLTHLSNSDFLSNLKQSLENPDEYSFKAFIEGYVESESPISSLIDFKTQLVHRLIFKQDNYSNDSLIKALGMTLPKNQNQRAKAPLFFHLADPVRDVKCLIRRNFNVDARSALEKVAEVREYKPLNWFEKIFVYFAFLLELIALGRKTKTISRGIKVGWTQNEYGILLGSVLTVFGEVLYNSKDKSLKINAPQYYLQDKASLLKQLHGNIWRIKGKMSIVLIPFLISSLYLMIRALVYIKKLRRKRNEQIMEKLWRIKSMDMKDEYKCIVCFDRPRNIIVKPCLHFSLCGICYNHLERKSCPICKKTVRNITEVHFT